MSSQNTFGEKVRLNDKVESRVRGDLYARFGGECLETYHCNKWQGAGCLAYGQIASAKIPLSRMISPALYWVMTGNDFTLDINNPASPKILVVGNNPDRQNIYSAALGLYNSRIVKLINKKKQLKSSVIIDELPTIYFRGLDNLIATARSNKVAVCLGFQDRWWEKLPRRSPNGSAKSCKEGSPSPSIGRTFRPRSTRKWTA